MGTKRIHTTLDLQGNSVSGLPALPVSTSDSQAAPTEFVGRVIAASGAKSIDLVNRQANAATLLNITMETLISGSDYIWRAALLPPGCKLYLEIIGFGSVAGLGVTAGVYLMDGSLVPGSLVTVISTTATLAESTAFAAPADGARIQVKFKNSSALVGTGSLVLARLNIRPS